jgi:hypothetical protein
VNTNVRPELASGIAGAVVGLVLAVVPGMVGQHHPAAASSSSRGQEMPPTRTSDGQPVTAPTPTASPTPPPVCNLPAAVSSTDAGATAESWATLYLIGPTNDCPTPAWRLALNAAAGGTQLNINRMTTAPVESSRVVGSATTAACTGLLCGSSAEKADLLTIPITPDPSVPGSDQRNGRLRLNLEQTEAGLWQVTWMMYAPPAS